MLSKLTPSSSRAAARLRGRSTGPAVPPRRPLLRPPRPALRRTPRPEEAARRAVAEGGWWHGGAAAAAGTRTVALSESGRCSERWGSRTLWGSPPSVTPRGERGQGCAAGKRGVRRGEQAGGGAGILRRGAEGAPGGGSVGPDRGSRRGGGRRKDVAAIAGPRLGGDSEVHPGAE